MRQFIIKLLPILFLFIYSTSSFAQKKAPRDVAWFLSADFTQHNSEWLSPTHDSENLTISSANDWNRRQSFSGELKFGKIYQNNIFLLSGLRFREHYIIQHNGFQADDLFPDLSPFGGNINFGRNIKIRSIEIPFEIRKDFQYGGWTLSPSVGFNAGVNLSKHQEAFYSLEINDHVIKEDAVSLKMRPNNLYNFSTTARFEVAYSVFNGNKLKLGAYHNFHIKDEMKLPSSFKSNMQSYGFQVGIEIPMLYLCNW